MRFLSFEVTHVVCQLNAAVQMFLLQASLYESYSILELVHSSLHQNNLVLVPEHGYHSFLGPIAVGSAPTKHHEYWFDNSLVCSHVDARSSF